MYTYVWKGEESLMDSLPESKCAWLWTSPVHASLQKSSSRYLSGLRHFYLFLTYSPPNHSLLSIFCINMYAAHETFGWRHNKELRLHFHCSSYTVQLCVYSIYFWTTLFHFAFLGLKAILCWTTWYVGTVQSSNIITTFSCAKSVYLNANTLDIFANRTLNNLTVLPVLRERPWRSG